jgi:hypothetical protein
MAEFLGVVIGILCVATPLLIPMAWHLKTKARQNRRKQWELKWAANAEAPPPLRSRTAQTTQVLLQQSEAKAPVDPTANHRAQPRPSTSVPSSDGGLICPSCATVNPRVAKYCRMCGHGMR